MAVGMATPVAVVAARVAGMTASMADMAARVAGMAPTVAGVAVRVSGVAACLDRVVVAERAGSMTEPVHDDAERAGGVDAGATADAVAVPVAVAVTGGVTGAGRGGHGARDLAHRVTRVPDRRVVHQVPQRPAVPSRRARGRRGRGCGC